MVEDRFFGNKRHALGVIRQLPETQKAFPEWRSAFVSGENRRGLWILRSGGWFGVVFDDVLHWIDDLELRLRDFFLRAQEAEELTKE